MEHLFFFIKIIPILIAAILVGRWFQSEIKHAADSDKPWYTAYISLPGLIILLAVLVVPILVWMRSH